MKILRALLLISGLFFLWGCTAADKAQWEEAMKDARGENMKMSRGNMEKESWELRPSR